MMTRTIVALAAALTLLLGGCTGSTSSEGGYISGDGSITRVAPDQRREAPVIDGTLLDGKPWSSTSVQGKVIVYNVWGSWCPPCQHEAPALVRAANRTTDTALFVGLNTRVTISIATAVTVNTTQALVKLPVISRSQPVIHGEIALIRKPTPCTKAASCPACRGSRWWSRVNSRLKAKHAPRPKPHWSARRWHCS